MSNKKTLLSLAVAAGLGAVSLQANAAAPTIYGDLAVALVYLDSNANGGSPASSSYFVTDNVSILGVKGEVAKMGTTSFFYDFNWILDGGTPGTHLSIVGMDGSFGTVTLGKRDNGIYGSMVDNGTYQQNWFYTPGMSSFQVSDAITYKTASMGGFQLGVQAFDIGKDGATGDSTTNYTVAGTYAMGKMTFGAGYTSYADLTNIYTDPLAFGFSPDTNQFGESQNVWSGVVLDNTTGVSFKYAADAWNVTAAYDIRKPLASVSPGLDDLKTLMVTGAYSFGKSTVAANYSTTSVSGYDTSNVTTLIYSYAPADALYYSVEYQTSNAAANLNGVTGATGGTGSSSSIALGVTYNF